MRTGSSKTEHEKIIAFAVNHLKQKGLSSICADHIPGFSQPSKVTWKNGDGHIPDISAIGTTKKLILEAETGDSIESAHTASQFELFAAFARQHNHDFWIIVPQAIVGPARAVLRKLNIDNASIWGV